MAAGVLALLVAAVGASTGWAQAASPSLPDVKDEVPVTATDLVDKSANNSPQLAVDPTESDFVVVANRRDSPDFGCGLQVSGDGGRGWRSVDPVRELPDGADKCYAPEVAFDESGRLFYLFAGLAGDGNSPRGVFLTTSTDRGRTFTSPRKVLGEHRYMARMALDRETGRLHLVWLQTRTDPPLGGLPAPPNPIMAAHSDDGGKTFSEPVRVSDPDRDRVVAPTVALGPDGAVHVAYYDLRRDARDYRGLEGPVWEGNWSLVLASSTDGAESFTRHRPVDDEVVPPERIMLVFTKPPPALATGSEGQVYAAWHDARNEDWDVFLRRSPDGGQTWQAPERVNDDDSETHQYLPQLSVAPSGRVDAVFYDRRRDDDDNRGTDVFATHSTDGGATFASNRRLTHQNFDPEIGPRYGVPSATGLNEFGSRIAVTSLKGRTLAAWTDTRNTGRGMPAQDIFATTIDFAEAGSAGTSMVSLAAGAGGVAGLAAAAVWAARRRRTCFRPGIFRVAGAIGLVAVGCSAAAPLPTSPPVVDVTMDEYRFDLPDDIPAGRVVFRIENKGSRLHRLALIPLPEDVPSLDEQLRGDERRLVQPLASIYDRPSGQWGTFAVDLVPGRYGVVCFTVDPDGRSHAHKGMHAEFRIP